MATELEVWQKRLETHFGQLATSRSAAELLLFALEHGLGAEDLGRIRELLHYSLAHHPSLSPYWLVWVVYATEVGYDYDGDEYWQTFEDRTPLWRERGSREQLRGWFRKFQKAYQGVQPTGPWADWFSIIAWPITHAILPKYLQLQLARLLYAVRYDLASLHALDPAAVGRLLARTAWDASSRLEGFLEQEELAGRIVLSLLASPDADDPGPILSATLRRIAEDLGRVGRGREWLRETRRVVADRFKGVGRALPPRTAPAASAPKADGRPVPLANIRPTVLLRRGGPQTWSAFAEIDGFASLSRLSPDIRTFLRTTRCRIRGAGDTWLPAGWLLAGSPRRILKSWPGSKESLLILERSHGMLDHLVRSECRLSDGRIWLFRIGADDVAREILGRFVRCEQDYVLVSEVELPAADPLISRCDLSCDHAFGYRIKVPEQLTGDETAKLRALGIQVARTIRIWPAALLSRGWDGEGHSEWLTSETPCFGIIHDHPVEAYCLRLNQEPAITIAAKAPGVPTFVQLARLPAGRHVLSATVSRAPGQTTTVASQLAEGIVEMSVREPVPWIPGTTSHVGMSISVDPNDPTLDDLWNEDLELSVQGPLGHAVHCNLSLFRPSGEQISTRQIGQLELPIASTTWARKLHDFVRTEANIWANLESSSGQLVLRGEELGEYTLRLSRDVKPVRWVCKRGHESIDLRLIDDTGRDEIVSACCFPFDDPLQLKGVDSRDLTSGFSCRAPGGLFAAIKGELTESIIVSSPHVEGGLQGLGIEIDVRSIDPLSINVVEHLRGMELWMKSRLVGPLASLRRDRVVRALCQLLYARLCGTRWATAEAAFLEEPTAKRNVDILVESVDRTPGLAIVLQRDHEKTLGGSVERTRWFVDLIRSFGVCKEVRLTEFALRVAGQPHQLRDTKAEELDTLLREISDKTVLLKAARLVALLDCAKYPGGLGSTIPRWLWRS